MATPARRSRAEGVTVERFDKFTDRARHVLTFAQDEARKFDHDYIGTEHLLLGLVREKEGLAARVLVHMGADLGKVRTAVEFIIGRGPEPVTRHELPLTPRAKRVIELAIDEARRLGHNYIGTEHLLLGLVREGEGIASGVLSSMGVDLDRVRHGVIATLSRAGAIPGSSGGIAPPPAGPRYTRFEDWSPASRAILVAAAAIAQDEQRQLVTHDLLLGSVAAPDAPALALLALAGASRAQIEEAVGRERAAADDPQTNDAGLSLATKEVFVLAEGEASRALSESVGVGHLLTALALVPTTVAARALASLGITATALRDLLAVPPEEPLPPEPPTEHEPPPGPADGLPDA
jgi:ATP-dependent Clp protease ATP-binding subunit ClpA